METFKTLFESAEEKRKELLRQGKNPDHPGKYELTVHLTPVAGKPGSFKIHPRNEKVVGGKIVDHGMTLRKASKLGSLWGEEAETEETTND